MWSCERGFAIHARRSSATVPFALTVLALAWAAVATPARAGTADVTIANMAFSPSAVTVQAAEGEPDFPGLHAHVNWVHSDQGVEHTVTFDDERSVATPSGRLSVGQVYNVVFERLGTFTYRCEIHPAMTGTVTVTAPATSARETTRGSGGGISPALVAGAVVAVLAVAALFLVRRRRAPGPRPATPRRR